MLPHSFRGSFWQIYSNLVFLASLVCLQNTPPLRLIHDPLALRPISPSLFPPFDEMNWFQLLFLFFLFQSQCYLKLRGRLGFVQPVIIMCSYSWIVFQSCDITQTWSHHHGVVVVVVAVAVVWQPWWWNAPKRKEVGLRRDGLNCLVPDICRKTSRMTFQTMTSQI